MKKAVFINACLRGKESRTKRIADELLSVISERYSIDEIDLTDSPLRALGHDEYIKRQEGHHNPLAVDFAHRVADAELIVVAFPFWDMSFPAVFKVFCEHITINGITFKSDDNGAFFGGCKAHKALLITTRGMDLEDGCPMDQGSSYLKAIGALWGIKEVITVSAVGMDTVDEFEREERICKAIQKGIELCKNL